VRRALLCAAAAVLLATAAPARAAKRPLPPGERVDLNRASVVELMRLPGVGAKRAQAIVAYRTRQPFRRAEDVVAVKGLGPRWFTRVKGNLAVGSTSPSTAGPVRPPLRIRR
jgi:competence protein ComEA